MKLIEMLVEEGSNGWKWPDGTIAITQDKDKSINQYATADGLETNEHGTWKYSASWQTYLRLSYEELCLASDWATAIITREQYEAALTAKNDGWIEWGGGKCPVEEGTLVDVRYRDSEYYPDLLGVYALSSFGVGADYWVRDGLSNDIIAYRLHKSQKAEEVRADAWNAYAGITVADGKADLNECASHDAEPVWNGEGLPPVGCDCEFEADDGSWGIGTVLCVGKNRIFWLCHEDGDEYTSEVNPREFRPLSTKAERKREEARKAIYAAMNIIDGDIADAIYDAIAAGKIPGVKLED